jgi:PIN domain nuclease of toxin-antitoxin system
MNVLLDTHAFIWLDTAPENLSQTALEFCQNQENQLYLSMASIWEMQIKYQLGKLNLRLSIEDMVITQQQDNDLKILDIDVKHIYQLNNLPLHHNDPFDRLILSQALTESISLISADTKFKHYDDITVIW